MGYVVAAYVVVWLVMFGYLWSLARRWEGVREEMGALRKALAEREAKELSALSGASGAQEERGNPQGRGGR